MTAQGEPHIDATGHHAQRYRAKATRRSSRFWWQPLMLLGLVVALWFPFVRETRVYETRAIPPPSEPRASYVVLAPADAAKALAGMRASWRVAEGDRAETQLDMGMFEPREEPAPIALLEQGARYPGVWQPGAVEPLLQHMPPIHVSAISDTERNALPGPPPEPRQGIMPAYSKSLADAGFSFTPPKGSLPERAGECRFYIETDDAGAVIHLLLQSPASDSSAALERALARGKARHAARGIVTLIWNF